MFASSNGAQYKRHVDILLGAKFPINASLKLYIPPPPILTFLTGTYSDLLVAMRH